MNTNKTNVQAEEYPKEWHDNSSSSKAFSDMENDLDSVEIESEKSSSNNRTSVRRRRKRICRIYLLR